MQQHPRIPEASNERPETQAARIASEGGAPLTAAAHLDVAVPNLESSFLDLRDPMTAPDGTKPTAMQANRLVAGFALGSMLLSAPMAAFNTVLIPQTVSRLSGINRVTDLAMLVIAGAIMTFLLNACIAVGSDHSYCRFGRRTPWIVSGSVLAAICMAILSACDFLPWAVFFWLATQAAYAMAAIPFAAAFGERVPDKFPRPRRFVARQGAGAWPAGRRRRGCCADAACRWRRLGWHYGFRDAGIRGLACRRGRRYAVGTAVRRGQQLPAA